MKWRTFNGEQILSIKDAVEQAIVREQKAGNRLKVCIGTDSQVYSSNTEFATVIVFLREKRGGFMYVHTESAQNRMSLKERMPTSTQTHNLNRMWRLKKLLATLWVWALPLK